MTREKRIPLSLSLASEIFAEVWSDQMLLGDLSGKLTCTEFEALADMLLAVGVDPELIEEFEDIHSAQDEFGDEHFIDTDGDEYTGPNYQEIEE